MKNRIYVIGMGPGKEEMMTMEALHALEQSDVIVGYTVYIKLLGERFSDKTLLRHRCGRRRNDAGFVLQKPQRGTK